MGQQLTLITQTNMLSSVSVRRETQDNDDETTVNNLRVVINEQMSS